MLQRISGRSYKAFQQMWIVSCHFGQGNIGISVRSPNQSKIVFITSISFQLDLALSVAVLVCPQFRPIFPVWVELEQHEDGPALLPVRVWWGKKSGCLEWNQQQLQGGGKL